MSQNSNKLTMTIKFVVTQILFTGLLLKQHVTIAEPELPLNNPTLQQLFPSLIFNRNLTQVFEDAHVVGYVGKGLEPGVFWPFELSSKIWNYVQETYGKFGDDEHLYVFLHSNETCRKNKLDIHFFLSNVTFRPSVVECSSDSGWKEINEVDGILCLARQVSDVVMSFLKGTRVDTDFLLDMRHGVNLEIEWRFILAYNFLLKCDQNQIAESYLQKSLSALYSGEQRNASYWMRDWFVPIYSRYGGVNIINTFFENKAKYFPRNLNTNLKMQYRQYERQMTVGEFVHFWSGAANVNLQDQFSKIVNWDEGYEAQLRKAQMDFPQMQYLCPSCAAIPRKHLEGSQNENAPPKMTVYFKQAHSSHLTDNYTATFTKEAPVYLYQPKFKSPGNPPVYRYDKHNPLYIVETEQNACYEVTCTSSHLVKWVTNIPVKDVARDFEPSCGSWKYMNSRRLNDKYNFNNQREFKVSPAAGRNKANVSSMYTIRFVLRAYESNMGVLTCQNIANSSSATHFYFTDHPAKQPNTTSTVKRYNTNQVHEAFHSPMELFWENSNETWFVVPCRGSRLSVEPNLTLILFYLSVKWEFYHKETQLWDSIQGSLVSQLQYEGDHLSALQYDPVKGFTLDPAFQYFLLGYASANSLVKIHFNCTAEDGSRMQFNVYPFQKALSQGLHDAKITEIVQPTQPLEKLNGCFYIRASNQFVSTVGWSLNNNFYKQYAVKLIHCSCPYECDIVRQCLDFQDGICYSERCEIQFTSYRLVNPHGHGLLRCIDYSIEYGFRPIYEYTFVGLDKLRYLLSNDVPTKAIMFLEETPAVLYTNVESTFRCRIAHFMLAPNIKFALIFKNETTLAFNNDGDETQKNTTELEDDIYNTRDVSTGINTNDNLGVVSRDIKLYLPAGVIGIMCLAPFHNSTEWVNVTRSFVTKVVFTPQINRTGRNQCKYFYRGETNFRLYCEAHGSPHPIIEWKFSIYDELKGQRPLLTNVTDKNNISGIKFPQMGKSFEGTYSCYASNQYGSDSYDYFVKYKEYDGTREIHAIHAAIVIILLLVMFRFLWLFFRYQSPKDPSGDLTLDEINEFTNGLENRNSSSHIQGEGHIKIKMLPFDKKFIINPNNLMKEKGAFLGEGHFGIVHRGLLEGIPVAVKTLKSTADLAVVKGLLSELKIMSFIGDHAHIIHFYGAVIEKIQKRVVEVVVELSPLGNLLDYLRKLNLLSSLVTSQVNFCNLLDEDATLIDKRKESPEAITTLDLIDWCRQIATGMDFISSKRVYHGDLAARNILIFPNNRLKITDFGFAKQLYSSPFYVKQQQVALPWRWMSLESLRFLEFSIQSDVWAFGVLMWEIFSLGQTPYPGLTWSPEFTKVIKTGMRMVKPDYCPAILYEQMLQCWDTNQEKRPPFLELVEFCDHFLQQYGPFEDTHRGLPMTEMNTEPTASTSTGSTSCTSSSSKTLDEKSRDIVYAVL